MPNTPAPAATEGRGTTTSIDVGLHPKSAQFLFRRANGYLLRHHAGDALVPGMIHCTNRLHVTRSGAPTVMEAGSVGDDQQGSSIEFGLFVFNA